MKSGLRAASPEAALPLLQEFLRTPAAYEEATVAEMWDDPHISRKMLAFHLDPDLDVASRNHAEIDRAVSWISQRCDLGPGSRLLDLGCGPGLYALRFARRGVETLGLDLSRRSLAHARAAAAAERAPAAYRQADYTRLGRLGAFDLALLSMGDYGVLAPRTRGRLLGEIRDNLAPSGKLALDVFSSSAFEALRPDWEIAENLMDGFWAATAYVGLRRREIFEDRALILDRYAVVEPGRVRFFNNWLAFFAAEALIAEIEAAGFRILELRGDLAGGALTPTSPWIAVIAEKQEE